jgi:DNA repair exonuclease SbcCD nuclease subunit
MRRSFDGYISATGMFKATFPYADVAEEEQERKYIKSLPTTSTDETAGNVWIPPHHALELAEEYRILPWIKALLDNTPIDVNPTKDATPKSIVPPPKFEFADGMPPVSQAELQPADSFNTSIPSIQPSETLPAPTSARGRPRRSASPSKYTSPRKIARARKPSAKLSSSDSGVSMASKSLEDVLENGVAPISEEVKETVVLEEVKEEVQEVVKEEKAEEAEKEAEKEAVPEPVVKVNVDTDVEVNGDVETTHTHVQVEMPVGLPELPLPEDTEAMIAKAKEMVEAAVKSQTLNGENFPNKRKAEEIEEADEEDEAGEDNVEAAPAKKVKIESELKKERVKTRALIGLSATLAIGYVCLSDTYRPVTDRVAAQ